MLAGAGAAQVVKSLSPLHLIIEKKKQSTAKGRSEERRRLLSVVRVDHLSTSALVRARSHGMCAFPEATLSEISPDR
jgi:hypothetical protein